MSENALNEVEYQINFINNSKDSGSFMVFQQDPNLQIPDVTSLAWFAKFVHPNTNGSFSWTLNYNFVWMENKQLAPGITSVTSQCPPADLATENGITLTYDGAYNFINPAKGSEDGSLLITMDQTIPPGQVSVGIGMSGAPTFLVPGQPNMNVVFTPHPEYWIAFGNYEQGDALNLQEMSVSAQIVFPEGITTMIVTLNPDNTWTVQPA
jgi:hypothetical protein